MPTRSAPLQSSQELDGLRTDSLSDGGATRVVETVVVALVPEYRQVKVRDREGRLYALTSKTAGVELAELHEGQRVVCTVTRKLPRVLTAAAIG
jgi:hypothetical protein